MIQQSLSRCRRSLGTLVVLLVTAVGVSPVMAQQSPVPAPPPPPPSTLPQGNSIVHKVHGANDRLEMMVNTSRILTLDQKIPQAQVNNPDIVELVPLSPTQVQVSAKKAGLTQVNLWSEDKRIYTVDVIVSGDARELALILRTQFPKASLTVVPVGGAAMISGYVDQQENVGRIMRVAEEYYPKVINNMTVSGVQQVLLRVKVMEVSRTKLRSLGFDWADISNSGMVMNGMNGLLSVVTDPLKGTTVTSADTTLRFSVLGSHSFFGVLDALREDKLASILAEPNLVTVSGRPAYFLVGGELGYQLSSGLTGNTAEFKEYGTRVDFVPIVLGNGRIRLEVRPQVSEKDEANSVGPVPSLKWRIIDTGVEMRAGQTLAIGGIVQQRRDATTHGVPWLMDIPIIGIAFGKKSSETNEVELLVLVTPELVDAMDANQVPPGGPGTNSAEPTDCELYLKGDIEVPLRCKQKCANGQCPTGGPDGTMVEEIPGQGACQTPGASTGTSGIPSAPNASHPPRNSYTPPNSTAPASNPQNGPPSFIGPVGYDVLN